MEGQINIFIADQDAILKHILERLDEQEADQSKVRNKMENDIERLFDITSQHTDQIQNQERILNGSKEKNKTLTEKVIFNKIILDYRNTVT